MDVGLSLLKTWTIGALALSAWLSWGAAPAAGRAKCAAERARLPSSVAELSDPSRAADSPAPPPDQLLLRLARSDNTEELCELLANLPASAEPTLTYAIVDVLDRAHARAVRLCATEALGRQRSAEAVSYLVELIDADDPDVQAQALTGLIGSDGELARASVLDAAHAEEPRLRHSAVLALLRAKHPAAFELAQQQLSALDDSGSLGSSRWRWACPATSVRCPLCSSCWSEGTAMCT
ncbi:MAG: HEAT repeat domain-containing protein [Polyangiaceae bacterium]